MPKNPFEIPEKYRDDPNLPEEERRKRARKREEIQRGAAGAAEWEKLGAEELAGLVSMVGWLSRAFTTGGPGGVMLKPEAAAEVGEVLQVIASNPKEVAKAVLTGYKEDIEKYGGIALMQDVELAATPIFFRLQRAAKAIRAGKPIDEVRDAYRAASKVVEGLDALDLTPAVRMGEGGQTFTGKSHHLAREAAKEAGVQMDPMKPHPLRMAKNEGFQDPKGNWVTREEAARDYGIVTSEDIQAIEGQLQQSVIEARRAGMDDEEIVARLMEADVPERHAVRLVERSPTRAEPLGARPMRPEEFKPEPLPVLRPDEVQRAQKILRKEARQFGIDQDVYRGALEDLPDAARRQVYRRVLGGREFQPGGRYYDPELDTGDVRYVELTHYSKESRELVDPKFQGTGQQGAEKKRAAAFKDVYPERSYFYAEKQGHRVEPRFANQPVSKALVPEHLIYDMSEDPQGLIEAASILAAEDGLRGEGAIFSYFERLVKESGYIGLNDGHKVEVFEPLRTIRGEDYVPPPRDLRRLDPGPMWAVKRVDEDVARSIASYDGATFNPRTGEDMGSSQLYAVSPFKMREEIYDHAPSAQEIAEFRMRNGDLFDGTDDVYVGGWKDKKTGKWYLDATLLVDNEADAIRIGRFSDQEGITHLDGDKFPETRLEPLGSVESAEGRWAFAQEHRAYREALEQDMIDNMLPDEIAEYRRAGKRRELWLKSYAKAPTPKEWASLIEVGYDARDFYPLSQMALEAFGDDAPRFTALLAALSPQRGVEENLEFAADMWEYWNRNGRSTNPDVIKAFFNPADTTQQNAVKVLTASNEKLLENVFDKRGLLSGLKVDPFYSNLMGNTQRVTIDTHMARGVGALPDEIGVQYRNRPVAASLRAGTEYYNRISGRDPINPQQAQAAAWAPIRAMTAEAGRRMKGMDTPPGVVDHFFEPAFVPEEQIRDLIEAQGGGSFAEVLAQRPELKARLEAQLGHEIKLPDLPTGRSEVRAEIAGERPLRGIGERIDVTRLNEMLAGKKLPTNPVLGLSLAASPFAKRYFEEAQRQAEERPQSLFNLFNIGQ